MNQGWLNVKCTLRNTLWKLNQTITKCIKKDEPENVVCKTAAILFRPKCVRKLHHTRCLHCHRVHCFALIPILKLAHYSDVIMGPMASQITRLIIVYSALYSGADQGNTKAPRHWPLCVEFTGDRWIHRTNGWSRGKCFHFMTSPWQ